MRGKRKFKGKKLVEIEISTKESSFKQEINCLKKFTHGNVIKSDDEYKILEKYESVGLADCSIQIDGTISAKLKIMAYDI